MQEVFRAIGRLARSNITVLINGESGTGKELVASALHRHSPRADKPFIALNMAAIPRDLLESELFGHERGAFTGAQARREGRFEQADGGTLFLDEIGDMPAELQTRLLRVLADGAFYRVGGVAPTRVNVRIIAATHQHLEELVRQGRFREDLFHRLNVIRIHLPALRERREDIPLLMRHFLAQAAQEIGLRAQGPAAQRRRAPQAPGLARQRTPIGEHRPLAHRHGLRAKRSMPRTCRRKLSAVARATPAATSAGREPCAAGPGRACNRANWACWKPPCRLRADPDPDCPGAYRRPAPGGRPPAGLGPQHPHAQNQGAAA